MPWFWSTHNIPQIFTAVGGKRERAKKKERGRERQKEFGLQEVFYCADTQRLDSIKPPSGSHTEQPPLRPCSSPPHLQSQFWEACERLHGRPSCHSRTGLFTESDPQKASLWLTYTYFGDWGWLQTQRMCQVCFKNLASENQLFPMCQSTNKAKVVAETLHVEFTTRGSPASLTEGARQAVYESLLWLTVYKYISIQPTETSVHNFFCGWIRT